MLKSDTALETKALNVPSIALYTFKSEFEELLPFFRKIVEDLRKYKTLPKSTLRRFASIKLDTSKPKSLLDFTAELETVKFNLQLDYLDTLKQRLGNLKSEDIIAIENCRNNFSSYKLEG